MKLINTYFAWLFVFFLFTSSVHAAITARWLGVAGLMITDGTTTLLFDPTFTKPRVLHWVLNSRFESDVPRVRTKLAQAEIVKADGIFSSHTHFDHAVDIGEVAKITNATVFGGPSLKRLADFAGVTSQKFQFIEDGTALQFGLFRIIPHRRHHAPILHSADWKFLPGPIQSDFQGRFYDYREGEVWFYRIAHPEARIIVDQGSHQSNHTAQYHGKTDVYFVGVANKKDITDLVESNILPMSASLVVPMHFDFFFFQGDWLESLRLPGVQLDQLKQSVVELGKGRSSFSIPVPFQKISFTDLKPNP